MLAVIGAVLWNSGLLSRIVGNNASPSTVSPPTIQPPPPPQPNPQLNPATATLTRAWTLPNVFSESGQFGVYVYASFSVTGITRGQFVARFYDSAGRPLWTSSGELEVSAPFSLNGGTGGSSVADASVFVPYDRLESLLPGDHALEILPSLLDDRGSLLTKGSLVAFPFHQDASSVTRVNVTPDATDPSGSQGILVTADFITEPLSGPQGLVILHFKDPASGQFLAGQQPYIDANGNLATWQPYTSATVRTRQSNVQIFLPYYVLPPGIQELEATISLFDPTRGVFLTPFVPFQISLP
ncbi:MAG: hypothetical protein A2Z21_02500 [Candidatus Fraserbacteria bacterium RBG_16_55_9]|uniref:Uncharacterized protein n=1 Tax=Fraserbacteria sp. (strain RBG_16_55_9) TaxID=1817864 RepID=A0A1F5UUM6_FRAXR|nr:MAG: hypothetical protein A2Z21_02500 [Candidatus Fraserbacteria bacterium RBG_16_55_9]